MSSSYPTPRTAGLRPTPLREQPIAKLISAPYKTGPWCAGSMVTGAFLIIPVFAAVGAVGAGEYLATKSTDARSQMIGGLALGLIPAVYLAIASLINVARFVGARRRLRTHYAQLAQAAGRDPHLDNDIARVVGDDGELWRVDGRRHVLRKIGAFFSVIGSILSIFDGTVTTTHVGPGEPFEFRSPRAGQFGYKLFWGIVLFGGGAALIYLTNRDSTQVVAMVGVYLAVNLLWWVPSLWRSVALRRIDGAWRSGAASVYARLPMDIPLWCASPEQARQLRSADQL